MQKAVITLVVWLTAATTSWASDLTWAEINASAYAHYQAGNYMEAYSMWLPLAGKGNNVAQAGLGMMFGGGRGVPRDYSRAADWYEKSAQQGNTAAQVNLGNLCAQGLGVPTDYVKAYAWFNLAAAYGEQQGAKNRDTLVMVFDMTPKQVAEGQALSTEIWEKIQQDRQERAALAQRLKKDLIERRRRQQEATADHAD